jgi:hypothetical protein
MEEIAVFVGKDRKLGQRRETTCQVHVSSAQKKTRGENTNFGVLPSHLFSDLFPEFLSFLLKGEHRFSSPSGKTFVLPSPTWQSASRIPESSSYPTQLLRISSILPD